MLSKSIYAANVTGSCIFMGCVYAYVIILTFLGPEYKGRSMEAADDQDLREARELRGAAQVRDQHEHSGSDDEKMENL